MKNNIPERIYIEKEDRRKYSKIKERLGKRFYLADIFSLAMIYGYMNNVRIPLKRKEGLFRTVSARDNFYSLMIMLYINETGEFPNDYEDISEAVKIAQEYANGGLKFLENDIYTEMDNFTNKLASKILKFNRDSNFSDNLKILELIQ